MNDETEVPTAAAAEPAPQAPEPMSDEALAKSIHDKALAATESKDGDKPEAEGEEPAATEAAPKSETETPAATEPEAFTPEQLADPAFFDKLDKSGWERLEKLNPGLYTMGKSVASARGKAFRELQLLQQQKLKTDETPAEEPKKSSMTPEMRAAWEKKQSLDPDEAIEGELEFQRLIAEATKNPDDVAQEDLRTAYRTAASQMPELADLTENDLDAAVAADGDMLADLELASKLPRKERVSLVASVMRRAGRIVIANQAKAAEAAKASEATKAAEAKKAESQKRLKANQSNASAVIAESPSGVPKPRAEFSDEALRASISDKVQKAARSSA